LATRGYTQCRFGQVHYYWEDRGATAAPPLFCLHATAYSGRTFLPVMAELAPKRKVVALDTPGYGGSDSPPEGASVAEYSAALREALVALAGPGRQVDLFGYHTGCTFAIELAAAWPGLVRRLVLIGIPFFEGPAHAEWRRRLVHGSTLAESLEQFRERWDYLVTARAPGVNLERAFANFVDELRAYPRESWAHRAIFESDLAPSLARVAAPALVINTDSPLSPASRAAAARMTRARVVEFPDIAGAPLETAVPRIGAEIQRFLDS
jgi:pimeloyl-ACP methyl ester carboxylesterase